MPDLTKILSIAINNAKTIDDFYSDRNDKKLPVQRENKLCEKELLTSIGKQVWNCMSKLIANNINEDGKFVLYNIELGDESPLQPLKDLFQSQTYGWRPQYIVNYFRGYHSPVPRLPVYVPDKQPLLSAYEKVQNGTRNTFNTVLSWALEKDGNDACALLVDCKVNQDDHLVLSIDFEPHQEQKGEEKWYAFYSRITLSNNFIDKYLFRGNYPRIIQEMVQLSALDPDAQKDKYERDADLIRRELELFRMQSLNQLREGEEAETIKTQLKLFADNLLNPNLPDMPPEEYAINDSIIQLLQGIAIMLRHWASRFICLTTREKPDENFSFNGQIFSLGIPNECTMDGTELKYLIATLGEADLIQRILARELYTVSFPIRLTVVK